MKKSAVKTLIVAVGLVSACAAVLLVTQTASARKGAFDTLASVSPLELPQVAAQLVTQAPTADQPAVARQVIQRVAALSKPGLTPLVVSAICRAVPAIAPDVVAAAISVQPGETLSIVRAGLHATPQASEAIVASVCKTMPQAYAWTAVIASQETPSARNQILKAIASSLPELASPLARAETYCEGRPMAELIHKTHELALSDYQENIATSRRAARVSDSASDTASLATPLERTATPMLGEMAYLEPSIQAAPSHGVTVSGALPFVQGPPHFGPPFTPGTGFPGEASYGGAVQSPSATRNYSAP